MARLTIPKSVPKSKHLAFRRLIAQGLNTRTAAAFIKQGRRHRPTS